MSAAVAHIRVFPSLCYISWIRRIQLEPVKHNCRILKAFLCLSLTVDTVGVMVSKPDCWSVDPWIKSHKDLFNIALFFVI